MQHLPRRLSALNAFGRNYKARGYRFKDASKDTTVSDFTKELTQFPMAAAVISRPYVKDTPGHSQIRAIHELELFAGGVLYRNLSGFLEIESEGEDGFGGVLGLAALNYDFNDSLHVQVAYAPTFFADPYDTLASARRLTATHYNVLNETFGGADNANKLRHSRQQVSIFGRLFDDRLFYNLGVGGLTEDKVADKSKVGFGRLAFDITPDAMVGAFGVAGTCSIDTTGGFASCPGTRDRDFSRYGLDAQVDYASFRFTGVFLRAKDDLVSSTTSETNDDSYIQAVYFGKYAGHQLVPLLRYQVTQTNDGKDETKGYTVGLNYYFLENVRGSIEYSDDISTPSGVKKSSNTTLQFHAAF